MFTLVILFISFTQGLRKGMQYFMWIGERVNKLQSRERKLNVGSNKRSNQLNLKSKMMSKSKPTARLIERGLLETIFRQVRPAFRCYYFIKKEK